MKIAQRLLQEVFWTPCNHQGLWFWAGAFYMWYAEQWHRRNLEDLEDICWRELEDAYLIDPKAHEAERTCVRYKPTRAKIADVVRALTAKARAPWSQLPHYSGSGQFNPSTTIAFRDKLFDVSTGYCDPRKASWFDYVTLPCDLDMHAQCPTWERCLYEWSDDDEDWIKLLQNWMGYCLLHHRRHAKWLLMHGKVRSGKGTINAVIRHLIGFPAFLSCSLTDLIEGVGALDGLQEARVLSIPEVSELEGREGERATQILKSIVGQDPLTINPKFIRQQRNIMPQCAIIVQANEIPLLPNKARGLSSKMLTLPFDVSFEGRENPNLLNELLAELPGIAAWTAAGAELMETARTTAERWPICDRSAEQVRLFHLVNNPHDHFLEGRFLPDPNGFVSTETIWATWCDWCRANNATRLRLSVARNQLAYQLCSRSTWALTTYRPYKGKRGLKGLRLRKETEDV